MKLKLNYKLIFISIHIPSVQAEIHQVCLQDFNDSTNAREHKTLKFKLLIYWIINFVNNTNLG